jgi:hypothetical protein
MRGTSVPLNRAHSRVPPSPKLPPPGDFDAFDAFESQNSWFPARRSSGKSQEAFNLDRLTAKDILIAWMETFAANISVADRVRGARHVH